MAKLRTLLVGAFLALAFICAALAQSVTQDTLSGVESWSAGQGPGGPSAFVTSNVVRNSREPATTAVAGATTLGVTAGFTDLRWGGDLILIAQPAAAVITLPPNPFPDGGIIGVCNGTAGAFATNVVTLAANTGQTLAVAATLTTLAAGVCAKVQFFRATTTWYRVQ